jgi:hypothetical protein
LSVLSSSVSSSLDVQVVLCVVVNFSVVAFVAVTRLHRVLVRRMQTKKPAAVLKKNCLRMDRLPRRQREERFLIWMNASGGCPW